MSPKKEAQKSTRFMDDKKAARKELTTAAEARISVLVKKAVSGV